MQITTAAARLLAVLGPTNTGKTHFAMERMLAHASGMIGFPLRLLARENYDRAVRLKGAGQVALITGEEKIVPPGARYFLCTVESMPREHDVAFLGVDEIQMCADPDRGHIFTDRLLHARGRQETVFMGAETIKPLIKRLVPEAEFLSRPRFSTLAYTGPKKITRLPPRSAIVAFSTAEVYSIAELVRRQRGGAAVVLGALSPRTRNAQVALYQEGDVDYLVATDAIGMGLNMDVDHVAFAATRKFDGRHLRALVPTELAQIAGRAGRHMNDGTFGTTADIGPLDAETVAGIENHTFEPLDSIFWRNPQLRFDSVAALRKSLAQRPHGRGLVKARPADDEIILKTLAANPDVAALAGQPDTVRLLWDVCRIPDFGGVLSDGHARLLARLYRFLLADGSAAGTGRLPTDWIAAQVGRIERTDGDIETLIQRIANIRTWTYIAHRADWLDDAAHWQERTRRAEDKLSDALHERLTQRFVDRRSAKLVSRMKEGLELLAAVKSSGEVIVEGHAVGRLKGFQFDADPDDIGAAAKAVGAAALRALQNEIPRRLRALEADSPEAFTLADGGVILWHDNPIARLAPGHTVLRPLVAPLPASLLDGEQTQRLRRLLVQWLGGHLEHHFKPLIAAQDAALPGPARGIVYRLTEALGSLARAEALDQIAALTPPDRRALRALGIRIGRRSVFIPALLKPAAVRLRGILWAVRQRVRLIPMPPDPGRVSLALSAHLPHAYYDAIGFQPFETVALRVDILERLAAEAWNASGHGPFAPSAHMLSITGCTADSLNEVLRALGYRQTPRDGTMLFERAPKQHRKRKAVNRKRRANDSAPSPFAKLKDLKARP
ncbi:MAG: helicase-related protein [Rhodospirillales bacterium]